MKSKNAMWLRLLSLLLVGTCVHFLMGMGCGEFSEGVNDLTAFCKAVGEKCSDQTSADCVQKLGGDDAELKSAPDYKGAKACVEGLSSCTKLPDNCWFFAVEKFKEGGVTEGGGVDAGGSE